MERLHGESCPNPDRSPSAIRPTTIRSRESPQLYAAKHNGFVNFQAVQRDPARCQSGRIWSSLSRSGRGEDAQLRAHRAKSMQRHAWARPGSRVPADCTKSDTSALIARGDRVIGDLCSDIIIQRSGARPITTRSSSRSTRATRKSATIRSRAAADPIRSGAQLSVADTYPRS